MCNRYSLVAIGEILINRFSTSLGENVNISDLNNISNIVPRYNIAPTQNAPVIYRSNASNSNKIIIEMMKWGINLGQHQLFNSRAELLINKKHYKNIFQSHRCLIPADGFYEWKQIGGKKIPYRFVKNVTNNVNISNNNTKNIFSFAGIYQENEGIKKYSIITIPANNLVSPIHNRMPLILDDKQGKKWLHTSDLLNSFRFDCKIKLKSYPISNKINSSKNDNKQLIQPIKTLNQF